MFENVGKMFKKMVKQEPEETVESKEAAKERLQLVLMQDRANVSADFLELMKQEILDVIRKYIEIDEKSIDVRLTTQVNADGTNGAPLLYANIPILNIKNEAKSDKNKDLEELLLNVSKENSCEDLELEKEKTLIDEKVLDELNAGIEEEIQEVTEKLENKQEEIQKEEVEEKETQEIDKKTESILNDIDELDYDDEDDDDVTFDDLLKAAEEADAAEESIQESEEKPKKKSTRTKKTTATTKTKTKRTTKVKKED